MAPNGRHSSASVSNSSCPHWLKTGSYGSCSLHSLGTDCTENTASNSSPIVVYVTVDAITWRLLSHCLTMDVSAEPFPSKSRPCWFHNSGFEPICHSIHRSYLRFSRQWIRITVFWDVTTCSLLESYQYFGGTCCLFLHGRLSSMFSNIRDNITSHRAVICISEFELSLWMTLTVSSVHGRMISEYGSTGGMRTGRRNKSTQEKTCSRANFSTTNSTRPDTGSNLGHRGGKPAANCLSYGTVCIHEGCVFLL
jgi:hypothetical protein